MEKTEDTAIEQNNLLVTNIKWHDDRTVKSVLSSAESRLPDDYTLNVPNFLANLQDAASKSPEKYQKFKDEIESFVYNFLTKKFGVECTSCQIWLPLEDN